MSRNRIWRTVTKLRNVVANRIYIPLKVTYLKSYHVCHLFNYAVVGHEVRSIAHYSLSSVIPRPYYFLSFISLPSFQQSKAETNTPERIGEMKAEEKGRGGTENGLRKNMKSAARHQLSRTGRDFRILFLAHPRKRAENIFICSCGGKSHQWCGVPPSKWACPLPFARPPSCVCGPPPRKRAE